MSPEAKLYEALRKFLSACKSADQARWQIFRARARFEWRELLERLNDNRIPR